MDAPVVVVGGGPVGSTLGLLIPDSLVLDRAHFPRDKVCGEGLMPAGAEVLRRVGVDLAGAGSPRIRGVRYRLPGGESVSSDFAEGCGYGTRRLRLDALLASQARVRMGVAVSAMRVHPDRVELGTSLGPLTTLCVIGADGLRSTISALMGWRQPSPGGARYAMTGHIATTALLEDIEVTLLGEVETYLAPTGEGEALFAVLGARGAFRTGSQTVLDAYRHWLRCSRPDMGSAPMLDKLKGAGPFGVRPRLVADGRVFLAGDAAGFLDPLTGDAMTAGLQQAVALSGFLAADPPSAASRYRRFWAVQWRRRRLVSRLALALSSSQGLGDRAVRGLQRRPLALQRLMTVNQGLAGLSHLGPRDWAALLGASLW
ncbi:MAG: FAD-dependent monooxygenase [Candidatus Dormibacteraeota bacterium]|nr:FAD-dependent monooxygenase [Candidatus Dormibacteraeota bacterium]